MTMKMMNLPNAKTNTLFLNNLFQFVIRYLLFIYIKRPELIGEGKQKYKLACREKQESSASIAEQRKKDEVKITPTKISFETMCVTQLRAMGTFNVMYLSYLRRTLLLGQI